MFNDLEGHPILGLIVSVMRLFAICMIPVVGGVAILMCYSSIIQLRTARDPIERKALWWHLGCWTFMGYAMNMLILILVFPNLGLWVAAHVPHPSWPFWIINAVVNWTSINNDPMDWFCSDMWSALLFTSISLIWKPYGTFKFDDDGEMQFLPPDGYETIYDKERNAARATVDAAAAQKKLEVAAARKVKREEKATQKKIDEKNSLIKNAID